MLASLDVLVIAYGRHHVEGVGVGVGWVTTQVAIGRMNTPQTTETYLIGYRL